MEWPKTEELVASHLDLEPKALYHPTRRWASTHISLSLPYTQSGLYNIHTFICENFQIPCVPWNIISEPFLYLFFEGEIMGEGW